MNHDVAYLFMLICMDFHMGVEGNTGTVT